MTAYTKSDMPAILEQLRAHIGADEGAAQPIYLKLIEMGVPSGWVLNPSRRVQRGMYTLVEDISNLATAVKPKQARKATAAVAAPGLSTLQPQAAPENAAENVVNFPKSIGNAHQSARMQAENLVPDVDPCFVPFGHYKDMMSVIQSKIFYPVFMTGLSGGGKSLMIEQICAKLKRNFIRVNITESTDEDDLIGGNALVDGNTVYREGPVLTAMRTGSVLALDEIDYGGARILCLQSIMEGKPYFNKKTGETIYPQPGFNVFATANTKGRGSDSGRFIHTMMMNEAFLERFPITVEVDYAGAAVETKILGKNFAALGVDAGDFAANLVKWAEVIRKSHKDGAVEDVISTRRLVAIARAFAIFGDRMKAIDLCLTRFDEQTKAGFLSLYEKIDAEVKKGAATDDLTVTGGATALTLDANGEPLW